MSKNMNVKEYVAIRVDMDCNADEWWCSLREMAPDLANYLSRNDEAVIAASLWDALSCLPGWEEASEPQNGLFPLIYLGGEGDQWASVVASQHRVFDELR